MYFGCLENAGNKTTAPVMPPEAPLYNHSADAQTVLPSPRSPQSGLLVHENPVAHLIDHVEVMRDKEIEKLEAFLLKLNHPSMICF